MITPSFSLTATERVLPNLALDFTTASLDPRVTFTRTTDATHPATYVNSSGFITSATNNQARFDYDPITLACKGLLIEESRVNGVFPSEDFSTSYTLTNITLSAQTTTTPANSQSAKIYETATTGRHQLERTMTGATNGATYTVSIFAKKAERDVVLLYEDTAGSNAFFNLTSGTVTNVTGATATITSFGNGWYRCTFTYVQSGTTARLRFAISTGYPTFSYAGDVTKGLYMWGSQWELGAFATSYIPTTSAALTRNADVATMTGTNFSDWFNASEGTFDIAFLGTGLAQAKSVLSISDNTTTNYMNLYCQPTNSRFRYDIVVSSASQAAITYSASGSPTAGTNYKASLTYKLNNAGISINANTVSTDTSCTIPTVDRLYIALSANGDTTTGISGWIKSLLYYPQRLINAELQATSK